MGGYGSGRPGHRTVAESCLSIDINRWKRDRAIDHGIYKCGWYTWTYTNSGSTCNIGYEVNTIESDPWVRLYYTFKRSGQDIDYKVRLTTTRQHFGGKRWWFICPLVGCGRRVGKLYLPPGGKYFGCRHCYNLTYTSSNESHEHDGLYRIIARELNASPREVRRAMKCI